MSDRFLTTDIINIFRAGNVLNISQLTTQLIQDPKWRSVRTQEVKTIVFELEKDKLLVRETTDGITRFRWYNRREAVVTPGTNLK